MAANRALALDPNCGGAHKALFMLEPPAGRFAACEDRLERARAATPEDTEILWSLYFHYLSVGRLGRSFEMAEQAYRLDPLRAPNVIAYANALFTANETRQSLALMQHALDRWQSDPVIFAITIWTASVGGLHDFARALLRSDWKTRYANAGHILMDRALYAVEGLLDDPAGLMERSAKRLSASIDAGQVELSLLGLCAYLGMDLDQLYDLVDRMPLEQLQQPGSQLRPLDGLSHLFLRVNARLRESPRFVDLCRRLGLTDYWQASDHWPECVEEVAQHYDFKGACNG
jgi:adenylate cyclase